MKQLLTTGGLSLLTAMAALAADPLFINDLGVNSPPDVPPNIDAIGWLNRATFNIDNSLNFLPVPYETKDTLYFTNTPSGQMFGFPGFRFLNTTGSQHYWMDTFTNNGTIATDSSQFFSGLLGTILIANSQASLLIVQATNIASTGPLSSGAQGIIHLEGKNINLKRNGLRTGAAPQTNSIFFSGSFLLSSNYSDDFGISDIWWGAGTNNNLTTRGSVPLQLDTGQFDLPFPTSPIHAVAEAFTGSTQLFTNQVILPRFGSLGNYAAAVWTNQTSPSNFIVQIVFYPTNNLDFTDSFDTNLNIQVVFTPDEFNGTFASVPVVAFTSTDFDIVNQGPTTSTVYLTDALATTTNVFLARNVVGATRRPDTLEVSRTMPFGLIFPMPANAVFDPSLIWRPSYRFNTVTNLYAAYQAQIASVVSGTGLSGSPTNFPGRIEIFGENVDLNLTRIRAESSLNIKATQSLTSNRIAQVDAPFVSFDVRSVSPPLVISNLAPASVRRLSGTIAAWSGRWNNFETVYDTITNVVNGTNTVMTGTNVIGTNQILFHVLIVDPQLQAVQPVVVYDFAAHATNMVIADTLSIGRSFLADGQGLEVRGGVIMPYGTGWARSNIQNVVNLTNSGTISIPQIFTAGATNDHYHNYVNHGNITAGAHFIHTTNFENSGNASIVTSGGLLQLDTLTASMMGAPLSIFTNVSPIFIGFPVTNSGVITFTNLLVVQTNVFTNSFGARMQANSDLQIFADQLVVSNSFLVAGAINRGSLVFAVTNWICDSSVLDTNRFPDLVMTVTNHWSSSAGFSLVTRPANSNLFGTYLASIIPGFAQESFHSWCAEDRGATTNGYDRNLAVGKLTLDGAQGSYFHFSSPPGQSNKAMYVDYLELKNFATNYNNNVALDISSDFTIYFANANLNPAKLDISNGGHLRWVKDFAGPLSFTNIVYPSGTNYTVNVAVVQSRDLDSDGDGIVNADDPTPFCECATDPGSCLPGTCGLVISMSAALPHQVQLFWRAPARSTNRIDYIPMAGSTNWHVLTNIVNGPTSAGLMVVDPSPMSSNRFYRLHQDLHQ